jgi:hypothetical protein
MHLGELKMHAPRVKGEFKMQAPRVNERKAK